MLDYESQIRAAVVAGFGNALVNQAALASLPLNDLLIVYWNWCSRGIPAANYEVHKSGVLRANPLATDPAYQPALDQIETLLESGGDVTPHLSRRIMHGFEAPSTTVANLSNRRDLDLLVNDWGIHHLHLSTTIEADGFVARTGPLLFAAIKGVEAFLIDILPHGGWTDTGLIEVCVREWPQAELALELKGVLGLSRYPTPAERKKLRNAAINSAIEVDGKFFAGRYGMSTAGTSIPAVRAADRLAQRVRSFAEAFENDPSKIATLMVQAGVHPPASPDWKFVFLQNGFGMLEAASGSIIRLE